MDAALIYIDNAKHAQEVWGEAVLLKLTKWPLLLLHCNNFSPLLRKHFTVFEGKKISFILVLYRLHRMITSNIEIVCPNDLLGCDI